MRNTKYVKYDQEIAEMHKSGKSPREIAEALIVKHQLDTEAKPFSVAIKYRIGQMRDMNQYKTDAIETDKPVAEFHWRKALEPMQAMQSMLKDANAGQDYATFKIKTDAPICVLVLGDTQLGSYATDYELFKEFTDLIINTPNLYVILVGDLLQMAIKMRGVYEMMDNLLPPKFQMMFLDSWLNDVKHKVIASTWDNHCYIDGTEVLSEFGWVDFKDLHRGVKVAQFDKSGNLSFAAPTGYYTDQYNGDMYDFDGNYHRQVVTENHSIVVRHGDEIFKGFAKDVDGITTKDVFIKSSNHQEYEMPVTDDILQLITWVATDGTTLLNHKDKSNYRVQFKLSKQRKIDDLTNLLTKIGVPFTIRDCKQEPGQTMQPKCIRIYSDWAKRIVEWTGVGKEKSLPKWFMSLSKRQLDIVLETLAITDGCRIENSIAYTSNNKQNIDVIHFAATVNGYQAWYKEETSRTGYKKTKPVYKLSIHTKGTDNTAFAINRTKFQYAGLVHCLQTPLGTLVTRYNGKVAFSGNSVMREEDGVGYSNYADIFKRHTIYFNHIGHLDVQVNEQLYKFAVSHFFLGRSEMNPCHAPMKYMRYKAPDRDIAIQGDFHVPGKIRYFEGQKERVAIVCGSIQTNSGYAKRFFNLVTQPVMPCVVLHHDKKMMTDLWSVGEWLELRKTFKK